MPKRKTTGSETLYDFDWEWSMMNIKEIEIDYEFTRYWEDATYHNPPYDEIEDFEITVSFVKYTGSPDEDEVYTEAEDWVNENRAELEEYVLIKIESE